MSEISLSELQQALYAAEERIRPHIRRTYLQEAFSFRERVDGRVLCKLENLQHTGSFKVRGALNAVLNLSPEDRARGVVCASTGNHGAAVGYALNRSGGRGIVYVPEGASPTKLANIARWGLEIREHGRDGIEAEIEARRFADESGRTYVSPYNNPAVGAGQGTIGLELVDQSRPADFVFVALGGGGLISGTALALKAVWPQVRIVACSPANSAVMMHSVAAGRILDLPSLPTLSDGTAGGVEENSLTFNLCRELVDEFVSVTEEEIATAMRLYIERERQLIEGAAGVALAGCLKFAPRLSGCEAIVLICGSNISLENLQSVLCFPPL